MFDKNKAGKELNDLMLYHWPYESIDINYNNTEQFRGGSIMVNVNPYNRVDEIKKLFIEGKDASLYLYRVCMDYQEPGKHGDTNLVNISAVLTGGYKIGISIPMLPSSVDMIPYPEHTLALILMIKIRDMTREERRMNRPISPSFFTQKIETAIRDGTLAGMKISELPVELQERMRAQLDRYCPIFMKEFPNKQITRINY